MSNNFSTVCTLLGAENEERLKNEIINVIIDRVEDDLTDWHEYLFNYDRMFQEIEAEITAEVKAKVRKKVMAKLDEQIDDMCNRIFND